MPLVFAVLLIIFAAVVLTERSKKHEKTRADLEKSIRKTNAKLERRVLDSYMREGLTFDEAYEATLARMSQLGYSPCIPRDAYAIGVCRTHFGEGSWLSEPEKYDSDTVKRLRDEFGSQGDDEVYKNFPTNEVEYNNNLKHATLRYQAIKVGDCFIYPGHGTCEVLGHNYNPNGTRGTYTVKVIKTGEIVNTIRIGDKNIRLMSDKSWN